MSGPAPRVSFAFQPIVDIAKANVFAYEALIRGAHGESAGDVLGQFKGAAMHALDRDARVLAINLAASPGLTAGLSLNLLPHSLNTLPDTVDSILDAALAAGIAPQSLIIEVTEGEIIHDPVAFAAQINVCRAHGMRLAIDDFGAGYAGLNLLAEFQPDIIKLDMNLVRGIDGRGPRQAIVRAVLQACTDLGIEVIAEGVETIPEFAWFRRHGVVLYQGYLFSPPGFETLPLPDMAPFSMKAVLSQAV